MMIKDQFKIGWRTTKTIIAVTLTSAIITGFNRGPATLGCLAAIFGLRNSNIDTIKYGEYRVFGNMIGIFCAVCLMLIGVHYQWVELPAFQTIGVGIGVLIVIKLCTLLGLSQSVVNSSASFLVVFLSIPQSNMINYGMNRVLDTFIGSLVALMVNYIFPNPIHPEEAHLFHSHTSNTDSLHQ